MTIIQANYRQKAVRTDKSPDDWNMTHYKDVHLCEYILLIIYDIIWHVCDYKQIIIKVMKTNQEKTDLVRTLYTTKVWKIINNNE